MSAVREAILAEARTWLGTPWHHQGRVKGHGVDCAMLVREVYASAGFAVPLLEEYPPDWFLHRDEERLLRAVEASGGVRVENPLPGDVALWRFGRCLSHAAIVVEWPVVIHAFYQARCVLLARSDEPGLQLRPRAGGPRELRFYSLVGAL